MILPTFWRIWPRYWRRRPMSTWPVTQVNIIIADNCSNKSKSSSRCPDPFEERHPCRVDPECQLGMILKAYFKKETLVSEVFSSYMRENYFTRWV